MFGNIGGMKRGTINHPKTLMLAETLGVHHLTAVGILEALWHWTATYAPKGDIGRYPDAIIASGAGFAGVFIQKGRAK